MPENDEPPNNGVDLNTSGDLRVGGDVVGRDKVTTTTTTTTITEGGPTARYAVIGIVVIAALAIIITAIALRGPISPASPTPTPSATPTPSPTTPVPASPTSSSPDTPSPTDTPTFTYTPEPTATQTNSPTPAPSATATDNFSTPTLTPLPTSALAVFDDFGDKCLDANKWNLGGVSTAPDAPMPTPLPAPDGCLQTQEQFITEGDDGHLSVFVSLEGDQTHSLAEQTPACFREAEVTLALDDVQVTGAEPGTAYLSLGLGLQRVSGDGTLEIRLEGGTTSGRLDAQVTSRLITAAGYQNFGPLGYAFHQRVTVAVRVTEVGQGAGHQVTSKKIAVYVEGVPLGPPLSILTDPCGLSLGYHADAPTTLDGFFDDVRLEPSE